MQLRDILKQVDPDGFAKVELLSGRPPRVVKGESFQPLSRDVLTDDEVLELCKEAGAGTLVDRLSSKGETWTFQGVRGPCVGTIAQRGREVLATFTASRPKVTAPRETLRRDSKQAPSMRSDDPRAERRTKPPKRDSKVIGKSDASTTKPEAGTVKTERPPSSRNKATTPEGSLRRIPTPHPPRQRAATPPPAPAASPGPGPTANRSAAQAPPAPAPPRALAPTAPTPPDRPAAPAAPLAAAPPLAKPRSPTPAPRAAVVQQDDRSTIGDALLTKLVRAAWKRRASDVHVSAGAPPEARIGGTLATIEGEALTDGAMQRLIDAITSEAQRREIDETGGTNFAATVEGVRARINVARTLAGPKLAIRLLDAFPRTLESLGLPAEVAAAVEHHQGLVLVTGPSGHGKTTTLAALVDHVNGSRAAHIITVEDPVEVLVPSKRSMVSQREVGTQTESFERALKGALRQDPDVIVVGELRDVRTVQMALSAAETGHLVLGTMNTPSTAATIDRLIGLFPPADQPQIRATLANALRLVLNQRLVPTADGTARVPACELLPGSLALTNLIRDDKLYQLASLMQRGRAAGILRLAESLQDLIRAGTIRKVDVEHLLPSESAPIAEATSGKQEAPAPDREEEPREPGDGLGGLLARAGTLWRRGS